MDNLQRIVLTVLITSFVTIMGMGAYSVGREEQAFRYACSFSKEDCNARYTEWFFNGPRP